MYVAAGVYKQCVLPPGRKTTNNTCTTKTYPTGYETDFRLFVENGEQDWFQLLFMFAKYESSTVNRTKVIEV